MKNSYLNVLITGGAGFIGSNLSKALLKRGAHVRILDNFSPQVHTSQDLPSELVGSVELLTGDVRDRDLMKRALHSIHSVVHFAAETGTGQSMYEIERYFSVNVQGTATMLDILQNSDCGNSLRSIVLASSRAIYGEGAYRCETHGLVFPDQRRKEQLLKGHFEPTCPRCGQHIRLAKTAEDAPSKPASFYGLTKQIQEQAILMFTKTRGINGFGLRYQNVYGPGQSLKNPYTGILAIFSNLARQNQPIDVYEDGQESRDFIYIDDVVEATARSVFHEGNFVGALNIGSGVAVSVNEIAEMIKRYLGSQSAIQTTHAFREGDIRHNVADTTLLEQVLQFTPQVDFRQGLARFMDWVREQEPEDRTAYHRSLNELKARGLMSKVLAS